MSAAGVGSGGVRWLAEEAKTEWEVTECKQRDVNDEGEDGAADVVKFI